MLALRRASLPLRKSRFSLRASCAKFTPTTSSVEDDAIAQSPLTIHGSVGGFPSLSSRYHSHASLKFTVCGTRRLSSHAGASNTRDDDDDDLEDEFSELEMPASAAPCAVENGNEDDLLSSDSDGGEEPHDELEFSEAEAAETGEPSPAEKKPWRRVESELFKEIMEAPVTALHTALDKWVEEGKELSRQEISQAMFNLRKRKMYGRAFQLSQWLESKKQIEFVERDYASRLDLIAKLHGLQKAEAYIETIPESFRGEIIYRTLLANCTHKNNLMKAEEIFSKMKDLDFPLTAFACNQLLILYRKNDKKKIADVLLLMENENVKPSPLTYQILIDVKGQSKDIAGMDKIVDKMKEEGLELNILTKSVLVEHYISAGLEDKAEALLKEIEGENLKQNRWVCQTLLPLYADLGKADDVGRIWKACEANPRIDECLAAIEAWGKLNKINEAEAVFEIVSEKWKLSSRNCSVLLKVYANHKMLMKGKDLINRMSNSGCRIGPLTWDAIVKLYVQAGEVEKADSILHKATQQSHGSLVKPLFSSFITILEQYAKRGDVHNSEKIFYRMKQAGYVSRVRQYQVLLQAYINAKLPAYGIRDRLKGDNVFANRNLANLLAQVDGFRKTPVSDLLD